MNRRPHSASGLRLLVAAAAAFLFCTVLTPHDAQAALIYSGSLSDSDGGLTLLNDGDSHVWSSATLNWTV